MASLTLDTSLDESHASTDVSTGSSPNSAGSSTFVHGEFALLVESLHQTTEDAVSPRLQKELDRNWSSQSSLPSLQGDVSPRVAAERVPPGTEGLRWHALVIPDRFFADGGLLKGLNKRDFNVDTQAIRPRRASLPITASTLLESLVKVPDRDGKDGGCRFIFSGTPLNEWPGLTDFELESMDQRADKTAIPSLQDIMAGKIAWKTIWKARVEGRQGNSPMIPDEEKIYRASLRAPSWSIRGWAPDSPGFLFWYQPHAGKNKAGEQQKLLYGTKMLAQLDSQCVCTNIYMFSHRYAKAKETPKDRLTYHTVVLLEWNHKQYLTVVEMAYLNGIGGYKGQSNWVEDRDQPITALYKAFPPELVQPWNSHYAEVRCYDIQSKNLEDFKRFVQKFEGKDQRFLDPQLSLSLPARLTFRSKPHIAQYLLNYIQRNSSYEELKHNCQTFAADLCAFLAGKKKVVPFHPASRLDFKNRTYLFLYEPSLYETREEKKKNRKINKASPKKLGNGRESWNAVPNSFSYDDFDEDSSPTNSNTSKQSTPAKSDANNNAQSPTNIFAGVMEAFWGSPSQNNNNNNEEKEDEIEVALNGQRVCL